MKTTDTINGKTPEEIKKGLECGFCHECPYDDDEQETVEECARQVHKDAIAYIQQLEDAVDVATQLVQSANELIKGNMARLESRISQLEMERDKVVKKLKLMNGTKEKNK